MGTMSEGEAITPQGLEDLKAQLAALEGDGRRQIAQRILAARELGDLSENAEYHIAKEDQAHLETKILRLTERLRNARVVSTPATGDVVAFGATVHVIDDSNGRESAFTLVGPTEANLREGKLSSESPMAKALMGHKPGDQVTVQTPGGMRSYRVERIGA